MLVGKIYDIPKRKIQAQPAVDAPGFQPGETTPFLPILSKGLKSGSPEYSSRERLKGKLKLQKLVLERVPLSIHVCIYAFDWSVLTDLTLLRCGKLERLWKMLRKHFRPTQMRTTSGVSPKEKPSVNVKRGYHLALKVIHTDATSLPLIDFIRETLAPNSLEGLFLLHRPGPMGSLLSLNDIFKGAVKPHHKSLRKVLLKDYGLGWTLPTKMALYLTSGRMKNLAELAVGMNFKDWHTFLRRLPNMPQLRFLNILKMLSHPTIRITELSERDFASQILNVVSLRPEVGLRYFGMDLSCFEILEAPATPLAGRGAGSRAIESSPASSLDDSDEEESSDDEFGDAGDGLHPLFVNAASSGEDGDDEDVEMDIDDEGDDEDGDEDDGFVEPGSESVKFELRKVDFWAVEADIMNVLVGQL